MKEMIRAVSPSNSFSKTQVCCDRIFGQNDVGFQKSNALIIPGQ